MARKRTTLENFNEKEAESAEFLSKLNKVTKVRKTETKMKYHKFEFTAYQNLLNKQQKRYEDEIDAYYTSMAGREFFRNAIQQNINYTKEQNETHRSMMFPIKGANDLLKSLADQKAAIQSMKTDRRSETLKWKERGEQVGAYFQELRSDFQEQWQSLRDEQTELESELRTLNIEPIVLEDSEIKFDLPPGMDVDQIKVEYSKAVDRVNEFFTLQLNQLKEANFWTPDENKEKIMQIYHQYITCGKPRERYMQRLLIQFPKLGRAAIDKMDKQIESERWNAKKRKNIRKDWNQHIIALKSTATEQLQKLVSAHEVQITKDLEFLKQQKHHFYVTKEHWHNQEKYEEKKAELDRLELEKVQMEQQAKEHQDKLRSTYVKAQKKRAEEIKQQRQVENAETTKLKVERDRKITAERKGTIQANKPKVNRRQDLERIKQSDVMMERENARSEAAAKAERIKNAVENYDHVPKVEVDRNRVQQHTQAQASREAEKITPGLFKATNGFTADKLMSDMRYKISSALHDAGMQSSEYATQVLAMAGTFSKPRPDMLSTNARFN